jgi:hypothetical protein
MSMSTGDSGGGLSNEINVTPMIDVLLVLLIIFMAVLPSMRKAIDIQLPDPNPTVQPANAKSDQIVLEVLPFARRQIRDQQRTADRGSSRYAAEGDLRSATGEGDLREGQSAGALLGRDLRDGRRAWRRCESHRYSSEGHARKHAGGSADEVVDFPSVDRHTADEPFPGRPPYNFP